MAALVSKIFWPDFWSGDMSSIFIHSRWFGHPSARCRQCVIGQKFSNQPFHQAFCVAIIHYSFIWMRRLRFIRLHSIWTWPYYGSCVSLPLLSGEFLLCQSELKIRLFLFCYVGSRCTNSTTHPPPHTHTHTHTPHSPFCVFTISGEAVSNLFCVHSSWTALAPMPSQTSKHLLLNHETFMMSQFFSWVGYLCCLRTNRKKWSNVSLHIIVLHVHNTTSPLTTNPQNSTFKLIIGQNCTYQMLIYRKAVAVQSSRLWVYGCRHVLREAQVYFHLWSSAAQRVSTHLTCQSLLFSLKKQMFTHLTCW